MKICEKCHKSFDDSMSFCPYCGEKLSASKTCPKCKKEVPEDADFCPFCGENLKPQPEEIKQEVVGEPRQEKTLTEDQVTKYKRQIQRMRRSKTRFTTAGALCFGLGLFGIILGIILIVVNAQKDIVGPIVFGSIILGFGSVALPLGIIFFVLASALYSRRIENRERVLEQYK